MVQRLHKVLGVLELCRDRNENDLVWGGCGPKFGVSERPRRCAAYALGIRSIGQRCSPICSCYVTEVNTLF